MAAWMASFPSWLGYAATGGLWLATAVGWFFDHKKKKAEIKRLDVESVRIAGESLERLQKLRRAHAESVSLFGEHAKSLTSLLRENAGTDLNLVRSEVEQARNAACAALFQQAFPRLREWSEYGCLIWKHEPEKLEFFLKHEVAEELSLIPNWILILNLRSFTEVLGFSPAGFSGTTLIALKRLALDLPKSRRAAVQDHLASVIGDIIAD